MPNDFLERRIQIRPLWVLYSLILLLGIFFIAYSVHNNRIKRLNEVREAREVSVIEAKKQVELLQQKLAFRKSDEYVARAAKEKFGYMMEEEIRFMFEGLKAPEYIAPSIPVEFVPMETEAPESAISDPT